MPIRTIVAAIAPDDGETVAGRAAQLALAHGARLMLLAVIEELPAESAPASGLDSRMRRQATERLHGLAERLGVAAGILLETGKAHVAIRAVAARVGADLLLIGAGRPHGLRERMFGSTADRLIRAAPCPLLLVKRPVADPYLHAVVGVDFSADSQRAAQAAAMVAPAATLTLLHMVEPQPSFEQAMLKNGVASDEIDRYRRDRLQAARRRLRRQFAPELPQARRNVRYGDAAEALVRASKARPSVLLAIGAQGADRMVERLLGSVARKVLLKSRSDVLLIPG